MPSQETTLTQTRWYRFCLRGSQNPAAQFLLRIQYILAGQSQAPIQPLAVQVSTSFVLRVRTLMDCSLTCTVKTTSADLEASPFCSEEENGNGEICHVSKKACHFPRISQGCHFWSEELGSLWEEETGHIYLLNPLWTQFLHFWSRDNTTYYINYREWHLW